MTNPRSQRVPRRRLPPLSPRRPSPLRRRLPPRNQPARRNPSHRQRRLSPLRPRNPKPPPRRALQRRPRRLPPRSNRLISIPHAFLIQLYVQKIIYADIFSYVLRFLLSMSFSI